MLNIFGSVANKDEILVPQTPMIVNFRYSTKEFLLSNSVPSGSGMSVSILKCYKLFGDLQHRRINQVWGFIYYIVETGSRCSVNNTLRNDIVFGSWLNTDELLELNYQISCAAVTNLNPSELIWYVGFCTTNRVHFNYYTRDKQQIEKLDYYRKLVAENSYKLDPPVSRTMRDISHLAILDWTLSPDTFRIRNKPYIEKKTLRNYSKNLVI